MRLYHNSKAKANQGRMIPRDDLLTIFKPALAHPSA
jgi:hypothetical protein